MKITMKAFKTMFILMLLGISFIACDNDDDEQVVQEQNIVEFVQDNSDYSMLLAAVQKAGLTATLESDGPFTVFAPDNDAFQRFLDAAGTGSIDNTPADVLESVLLNHVLGGEFMSSELSTSYANNAAPSGYGANLSTFIEVDGGVEINGVSTVVTPDITVTNGVIHAVDEVIGIPTVVTFATSNPDFSTLVAALTRSDLTTDFVGVLSGDGPFTVFAPTNTAFQALLDSNPDWNNLNDIPAATLEAVLLYHVTGAGNVRSTDLSDGQTVTTLSNDATFTINLGGSTPSINAGSNSADIVFTDVQAGNGVVHVIDTVILP